MIVKSSCNNAAGRAVTGRRNDNDIKAKESVI